MINSQVFKAGMRRLASGIALVTTEHEGVGHGIAATSVTSLSAEPPSLLVCVNKSASCHDAIAEAGCFCVNLLSAEHADLLDCFASSARRAERFKGSDWTRVHMQPPHLATALAAFDCTVARMVEHGTHTIIIGDVRAVSLRDKGAALVYIDGEARPLAR